MQTFYQFMCVFPFEAGSDSQKSNFRVQVQREKLKVYGANLQVVS